MFDEDEGWEEARDEDGIKTMYRYEEGLSTITVRIEGAVDASVLQVSRYCVGLGELLWVGS